MDQRHRLREKDLNQIPLEINASLAPGPLKIVTYKYKGLIQRVNFYREKMSDSKIKKLSLTN